MFPDRRLIVKRIEVALEELPAEQQGAYSNLSRSWLNATSGIFMIWPIFLSSSVLAVGMMTVLAVSIFEIPTGPVTVPMLWAGAMCLGLLMLPLKRLINDNFDRKYLPSIVQALSEESPEFEKGSEFASFLAKNDPRFAYAIGEPPSPFDTGGPEWNIGLSRRIWRKCLSTDGVFFLTAAIMVVVAILDACGVKGVSWVQFGVAMILIGYAARLSFRGIERESRISKLRWMLLSNGFDLELGKILSLVRAYKSGNLENTKFWTKKILSELFLRRDDYPEFEKRRAVLETLLPLWKEWWGKKLPPGVEESFYDFLPENGIN